MDNTQIDAGVTQDIDKFIIEISNNPDKALSAINNVKVRKEMVSNNVKTTIRELEEELSKMDNPIINEIMAQLNGANSKEEIGVAVDRLDSLEQSLLAEIRKVMEGDSSLIETIKEEYTRG